MVKKDLYGKISFKLSVVKLVLKANEKGKNYLKVIIYETPKLQKNCYLLAYDKALNKTTNICMYKY